jgi:uncharacterized protein YlxP (DUF503 family)
MIVGTIRFRLRLAENHSLKGKRRVIKSLMAQVRNKFNVSVAEVALNDVWQEAELGIAAVGNSESFINSVLDKVMDFVECTSPAEVSQCDMELIHMGTGTL